jgi:hypothetical protein
MPIDADNGRGDSGIESERLFRRILWSSLVIAFAAFALLLADNNCFTVENCFSIQELSFWASGVWGILLMLAIIGQRKTGLWVWVLLGAPLAMIGPIGLLLLQWLCTGECN